MAKLLSGTRIYGTANVDTQINVGSNLAINTTGFSVTGNATTIPTLSFYSNATAGVLTIGNSTSTSLPTMSLANSTGNVTITPIGFYHTGTINAASHTVGSSVIANSTGVYTTGTVNSASFTTGGGYGSATGGVTANSTTVGVGNSTLNVATTNTTLTISGAAGNSQLTAVSYRLSNTTSNAFAVNTSVVSIGAATGVSANASLGSNGQVLSSNGTAVFWAAPTRLPRVSSTTSITSPLAWNSDNFDMYATTAQATSLTISADAGTPVNGQKIIFRFKDSGTSQTLAFTTGVSNGFRAVGVIIPTATSANRITYVGCIFNSADSRWDVIAVTTEI